MQIVKMITIVEVIVIMIVVVMMAQVLFRNLGVNSYKFRSPIIF